MTDAERNWIIRKGVIVSTIGSVMLSLMLVGMLVSVNIRIDRLEDRLNAIAIEAATAGETAKTGSTRSAKARAAGIAQKP